MIYLVTENHLLFESEFYTIISSEKSLEIINEWDVVQFDTETSGRDPHVCKILCAQFGNREADIQIVVDTAIQAFAEGLISRYTDEVDDINGVINMKKNNCFIAELGTEFVDYFRGQVNFVASLFKGMWNISQASSVDEFTSSEFWDAAWRDAG